MNLTRNRIELKSNLETIERFILKADVTLTDEQIELLDRIRFADEKLRERRLDRDEIVKLIVSRFGVTRYRADQDITDCQKLFGTTRKLDKRYLLHQHIEGINKQITSFTQARQYALIPKLNQNLTDAINALPAEGVEDSASPTTIIFIVKAPDASKSRSIEEILAEAQQQIENEHQDEYIEFEES